MFLRLVLLGCLFMGMYPMNSDSGFKKAVVMLSEDEQALYHLITEYRKIYNLPPIPLSKSLTYVAQQHAYDFVENNPETNVCNLHSWSNQGKWKGCCYKPSGSNASCMWDKPKELTNYIGRGYEISCSVEDPYVMTPDKALKLWKSSPGHLQVIVNKGDWRQVKWNAMGIGMYKGYACVWFGQEVDKDGEPLK